MKKLHLGLAFVLVYGLTFPAQGMPMQQEINSVVSHLVGIMDTTAQNAANPKAPSVRMTTCKIKIIDNSEGIYLYQEQALTKNLEHPYRQRILKIQSNGKNETVESQSFKLKDGESLIGLCKQPETARKLPLSALGDSVCHVFLKPSENGFIGETPPEGCPANIRGAVRITNKIILHSTGMDTWDRGFDIQGNQVWGAEGESYQYRWVKQEKIQL